MLTKTKYSIIEREDDDLLSFRIEDGPFKGVIYKYGKVSVAEEDNQARLKFGYLIEDHAGYKDLEEDIEFRDVLGEILQELLQEGIDDNG